MKKVSLRVSLAFPAAPGEAFAIQRARIQTKTQTTSHTNSFPSPKRAVIGVCRVLSVSSFEEMSKCQRENSYIGTKADLLVCMRRAGHGARKAGHADVGVLICTGQWWQLCWVRKSEIKHFQKQFVVETFCPIAQDTIFLKTTNQNQTKDICICETWVSLMQYCFLLGVYHCYPTNTKWFCVWAFSCVPSFLTCLLRVILPNLLKRDECTSTLHSRLKEIQC